MKKLIIFLLIVFSFLAFRNTVVYAWPDFHIDWPAISFPTSTPTLTPTVGIFHFDPGVFKLMATSTPTPTNTPTLTSTPTKEEPTVEPTKETVKEEVTTELSPTSTTAANVSPTQKPKKTVVLSPKDLIYGGVLGLLVLIVLVQAWPAIKKFLHDKTA